MVVWVCWVKSAAKRVLHQKPHCHCLVASRLPQLLVVCVEDANLSTNTCRYVCNVLPLKHPGCTSSLSVLAHVYLVPATSINHSPTGEYTFSQGTCGFQLVADLFLAIHFTTATNLQQLFTNWWENTQLSLWTTQIVTFVLQNILCFFEHSSSKQRSCITGAANMFQKAFTLKATILCLQLVGKCLLTGWNLSCKLWVSATGWSPTNL